MEDAMEMEISYQDPSSVVYISDDDMQEVWVEEIVIEEDGSPASPLSHHEETSPSHHDETSSWNPLDVLILDAPLSETTKSVSPSEQSTSRPVSPWRDISVLSNEASQSSDASSNSPSYIRPDTLTDEENGLLDESFQLMEDLMSKKDMKWKHEIDENQSSVDENMVQRAQALLDELDQLKQEPFSDWLEEKTDLPVLDELGGYVNYPSRQAVIPPTITPYHPKYPTPVIGQIAPVDSSGLTLLTSATLPSYQAHVPELSARTVAHDLTLVEPVEQGQLEDVGAISSSAPLTPALIREFETVLHQTLTPPHTPPQYLDLVNNQEEETKHNLGEEELDALINSQVASFYEDKTRFGQDWAQPQSQQDSPPPSTEDSEGSSESDPEWAPSPKPTRTTRQRNRRPLSSAEERKLRKKEQNKNAATRYRMKKKQEQAGIVGEESVLLEKNIELKEKATELQREVKYLKSLMRDICKAKGLL